MKILFYTQTLSYGDGWRATAVVVNELSRRGHEVYISLDEKKIDYPVDDTVQIIVLQAEDRLGKIGCLRDIINDIHPDVNVGVFHHFFNIMLVANIGTGIPIIAWDYSNIHWNPKFSDKFIREHLYNYADATVLPTENDKNYMKDQLHNTVVINNPLPFPCIQEDPPRDKVILCAGRFDIWETKGFDRIFQIWSRLQDKYPEWTLEIAGNGKIKNVQDVDKLCQDLGIKERVFFWGSVLHMDEILRRASIFVLPSREEGFPCTLTEAMSQGCASVAFSIRGNIDKIITNGQDGIIIPDDDLDAFQEKLEELIVDSELRQRLGRSAIESVKRFEPNVLVDQWESLLQDVISKKK